MGITVVDTCTITSRFKDLCSDDQERLLCELFNHHSTVCNLEVPEDFLSLSLNGMKNLESAGKVNVLYELAKGVGRLRPDSSDTCFPMKRMPFGMLEYMTTFFNSTPGSKV